MRCKSILVILSLGLLLSACSNFTVTPASNQSTNNGNDAARIK